MKKFSRALVLILALAMTLMLFACGGGECTSHVDASPKNAKCDVCGADVPCTACVDGDKNAKCDVCGGDVACAACVDADKNAKCDVCGGDVACAECTDRDGNGKCDVCSKDIVINDIVLIELGYVNFQFVLADGIDADVKKLVEYDIVKEMDRKSGIEVKSVVEGSEEDNVQDIEVLVGGVQNRGEQYTMDRYELGEKGYVIRIIGTKIVINAGSDKALADAVEEFAEDILDYENRDLYDAVMTAEQMVIKYQDNYKITSLAVNGTDMKGYTIAADLSNEYHSEAASSLRDTIYSRTGYWFKIVSIDEATDKSIIIKSVPKVYNNQSFKISASGSQLLIECAFDNKLKDTVAAFATQNITLGEGDVNFTGSVFNRDISYVTYEEFGAVGNGVTDDFFAIKATHDFANISGQIVKATAGKTYLIHETRVDGKGTSPEAIIIKTNVDWCGAEFIIDDRDIKRDDGTKRGTVNIFSIRNDYEDITITDTTILAGLAGIGEGTTKINLSLGYPALLTIYNSNHKVYRRSQGGTLEEGDDQSELILIDAEGNVDPSTPFLFDYAVVTSVKVHRLDVEPLTVKNGTFTTWASQENRAKFDENGNFISAPVAYILRGITVNRPGTVVEDVKHYVEKELPWSNEERANHYYGHPYNGFFCPTNTNDVLLKDCVLTGRRAYDQSSYDLKANYVSNLRLVGCIQSNFYLKLNDDGTTEPACDITFDENGVPTVTPHAGDKVYTSMTAVPEVQYQFCWGVSGTNYCKSVKWINCALSRFDAHCGVVNGEIKGTTINVIALVGKGEFLIEGVTWISAAFAEDNHSNNVLIALRGDYGSPWEGTITIKDTKAYNYPTGTTWLVYHGFLNHYYGYTCHFPNIVVDNLEFTNTDNIEFVYAPWIIHGETAIHESTLKINRYINAKGTLDNENPIVPPEFVKILNNEAGENYVMPYDIPFFYNTKFEIDTDGDTQPDVGYYRNEVYDGSIE